MSKSVSVQMDRARLWHPGDIITGNVVLQATEQVDVKSVIFKFEGRCKTKLVVNQNNSRRVFRGRVVLFYMEVVLFQGPYTLPPGSRSWPFEFRIPDNCQYKSGDTFEPGSHYQVFDNNIQQPLPPTFASYHSGFAGSKECEVTYMVNATLDVNKFFSFNKDDLVPLKLVPWRWQPNLELPVARMPKAFEIRSLHLDPAIQDRGLSFSENMKSFFQPGKLPKAVFNISVLLPQAAVIGQPLDIRLSLEHSSDRSTIFEKPSVELTSVNVKLTQRVWQITTGVFAITDRERNWENDSSLMNWEGKVPIKETLDLRTVTSRDIFIPMHHVPTFSTFNIAVAYSLSVKYRIECADKTEKFEQRLENFSLLSSEYPGIGVPFEQNRGMSQQITPTEEEQLPAYTKVDDGIIR